MNQPIIPVLRPRLPQADSLLPWLRLIDENRIYSNMGPLSQRLAQSLAERSGAPVLPVANATIGLTLALMARSLPPRSLCMVPSWTFAASGHAILAAGLTPFLVDVDPVCGHLTPDLARSALSRAPGPVTAVMPVSAFGHPLDSAGWQTFAATTGIAVVADCAAAFDTVQAAPFPCVVSLHATKLPGAGEGGFILCRDPGVIDLCMALSNFGFHGTRVARMPALNGKLSEYHAAVALAALEDWPHRRARHQEMLARLRAALPDVASWRAELNRAHVSATLSLEFPCGWEQAQDIFSAAGIETRRWWGDGLARQPAFAACPALDLPETEHRAAHLLGLPLHLDLTDSDIDRIASAARTCLAWG